MRQFFKLLKASMTEGMDIFRVKKKKTGESSGVGVTIALMLMMSFIMLVYSDSWFYALDQFGRGTLLLAIVVVLTTVLTLIEGIYKSSSLLYNTRDDDLLLTLPISRGKIVALKLTKFYLFELIFNSMFLLPAIAVYFVRGGAALAFAPISVLILFLAPVIPVVLSCLIGAVISAFSSKFKKQTVVQIIFTFIAAIIMLVASFYFSMTMNSDVIDDGIVKMGETMTNIYYPAKLCERMATEFNIVDLAIFILMHLAVAGLGVLVLAKTFFKINTRAKMTSYGVTKKVDIEELEVRGRKPIWALLRKELNKFFGTPVFITNAGFGIILFVIGAALLCWKFDDIIVGIETTEDFPLSTEMVRALLPVIVFALMSFTTLFSFITSSMISLEGKSINILKTLPVPVMTILRAKIIMAMIVILPLILVGDIVMAIWFGFGIVETLLLIIGSVALPASMQIFGILINLKYPMMDAENDMEVVKQSRSTMICTFVAMGATGITIGVLMGSALSGLGTIGAMGVVVAIYTVACLVLDHRLKKVGAKRFNKITA